jgi:hypothetical protein
MRNKLLFTPLLVLSIIFISSNNTTAQEVDREIGLRMSSLNSFNFVYKKAKEENKYLRFQAGAFNANFASINNSEDLLALGFNLAIGIEKRKPIDDKLSFIHGFEPALRFSLATGDNSQAAFNPSIGYVLGFQLNISDSFGVNLETTPSIGASFYVDDDGFGDNTNYNLGFNSNSVALSIVYRFKK